MREKFHGQFHIFKQCRELNVEIWSCPRFIFIVMGVVIMLSILTTYFIAERYTEPDIVITLVTLLTIFLLTTAQIIVTAFEKVVYSRARETIRTKEVLEMRDQFVHIAIHDLASSATAIKWGLRTIDPKTPAAASIDKAIYMEIFQSVRDRNERLIELARQILLITRIESGHLELHPETVEPESLIAKVMIDLERTTKEKNIAVTYTPPTRALPITSDPVHLTEIFRTLLMNAITHTNPERGTITITVGENAKGGVEIVIENNGNPISEETRAHVFEKLWRKEGDGDKIAGTSFSLYIVKSLVDILRGTIRFTTEPEKTIFMLTFPKE